MKSWACLVKVHRINGNNCLNSYFCSEKNTSAGARVNLYYFVMFMKSGVCFFLCLAASEGGANVFEVTYFKGMFCC